jgi:hypothetical protein
MSSYLADLAARSLGQVPVAEPRLASRFEPVASGPSPVAAASQDSETSVESSARAPRVATPMPWAATDRQPDATNARDRSERPEPRAHRHEIVDLRESIEPLAPRPMATPAPEIPIAVVPRRADALPAPPARHVVVLSPRIADDTAARTGSDGDREPHTIVRAPLPDHTRWQRADERLSALERAVTARQDARAHTAPQAASRSEWAAPRPAPRDQLRQPAQTAHARIDSAGAYEAPAVHVTIGRIDVRAIMPPPAARSVHRHAPQRPSLSLDDYLKQRSSR